MKWTSLRWTDLRDRLLTELRQLGYSQMIGVEQGLPSALGHPDSGSYLSHSQAMRVVNRRLPRRWLAAAAVQHRTSGPVVDVQRDRILVHDESVARVAAVTGRVVLQETVARLQRAGETIELDVMPHDAPVETGVVLDLPARCGVWCDMEPSAEPLLVAGVESAIRAAGLTPVPVRAEGDPMLAERSLGSGLRLGVGMARRSDGTAVVLYDDMKHLSRVLEAYLLGET